MYREFGISDETLKLAADCEAGLRDIFAEADRIAEYNQLKVLHAMQKNRVSEECFRTSTGYGHNDYGRDTLERVYADVFRTENALVRPQITCGTHAIATALFAVLRPGDELLCPAGRPYDTLHEVIGIRDSAGSLKEYGVSYREVGLKEDGSFDYDAIRAAVNDKTKLVEIQRSRGYSERRSFSVAEIGELIRFIKDIRSDILVMVDNCYGEFTEVSEPSEAGADMVAGSLIKNPGGGLVPTGGYICGTDECIRQCAVRLTAPGLGQEIGANLGILPAFYQGLFMAPVVVAGTVKSAALASAVFKELGFFVTPGPEETRHDIIQAVRMEKPALLEAFCLGIQEAAPVDAFVTPVPSPMEGYADDIIMAAGTFVAGSSIELSADGPLRPPYTVFYQGGLSYYHGKAGVLKAAERVRAAL
ncbi:MAG: methionine gamma-lyase family protein [Lachnospiraceae bacterium]|nr:methionine gamma-lyase family protein [Lachnospiraceae bacterium]